MYVHVCVLHLYTCLACTASLFEVSFYFLISFSKAKIIVNFLVHSSPFASPTSHFFHCRLFFLISSGFLCCFQYSNFFHSFCSCVFTHLYTHKRIRSSSSSSNSNSKHNKQVGLIQLPNNPLILNCFRQLLILQQLWCEYARAHTRVYYLYQAAIFFLFVHLKHIKMSCMENQFWIYFRSKQQLCHFVLLTDVFFVPFWKSDIKVMKKMCRPNDLFGLQFLYDALSIAQCLPIVASKF